MAASGLDNASWKSNRRPERRLDRAAALAANSFSRRRQFGRLQASRNDLGQKILVVRKIELDRAAQTRVSKTEHGTDVLVTREPKAINDQFPVSIDDSDRLVFLLITPRREHSGRLSPLDLGDVAEAFPVKFGGKDRTRNMGGYGQYYAQHARQTTCNLIK